MISLNGSGQLCYNGYLINWNVFDKLVGDDWCDAMSVMAKATPLEFVAWEIIKALRPVVSLETLTICKEGILSVLTALAQESASRLVMTSVSQQIDQFNREFLDKAIAQRRKQRVHYQVQWDLGIHRASQANGLTVISPDGEKFNVFSFRPVDEKTTWTFQDGKCQEGNQWGWMKGSRVLMDVNGFVPNIIDPTGKSNLSQPLVSVDYQITSGANNKTTAYDIYLPDTGWQIAGGSVELLPMGGI